MTPRATIAAATTTTTTTKSDTKIIEIPMEAKVDEAILTEQKEERDDALLDEKSASRQRLDGITAELSKAMLRGEGMSSVTCPLDMCPGVRQGKVGERGSIHLWTRCR